MLHRLSAAPLAWHVPARRSELVTALLGQLPAADRRRLAPLEATAAALLPRLSPRDGPLPAVLAGALRGLGVRVRPQDLRVDAVPDHLRLRLAVHDVPVGGSTWNSSPVLAAGRDLGALRVRLDARLREALAEVAAPARRSGATTWDLGTLPPAHAAQVAGLPVSVPLTLVDEGPSVGVGPALTAAEARAGLLAGTRRLLRLGVGDPRKVVRRQLPAADALALALGGAVDAVLADCAEAALDGLLVAAGAEVRDEQAFAALLADVRGRLPQATTAAARGAAAALRAHGELVEAVRAGRGRVPAGPLGDLASAADALVRPGFVTATGARRLADLPRYLAAARVRLDRLAADASRDAWAARELADAVDAWRRARAVAPPGSPAAAAVTAARWQLEELRVALFAPSVPTPAPISVERVLRTLAPALG